MIIKYKNDNYVNTAKATDYFFYNDTQEVRRLEVCFSTSIRTRIAITPQQEQALKEAIASGEEFIDLDNLEEDKWQTTRYLSVTDDYNNTVYFTTNSKTLTEQEVRGHYMKYYNGIAPMVSLDLKELTKEEYEARTSKNDTTEELYNLEPTYSIEDLYRTIYSMLHTEDRESILQKVTALLREVFGNPELDVNYYFSPSKRNFTGVYITVDSEPIPLEVFLFNQLKF